MRHDYFIMTCSCFPLQCHHNGALQYCTLVCTTFQLVHQPCACCNPTARLRAAITTPCVTVAGALLLQEAVNEQGLRPADPEGAAAWDQRRVQVEEALALHDQTERLQTEGLETAW